MRVVVLALGFVSAFAADALPDPLVTNAAVPVTDAAQWPARRLELLELFRHHVYGRAPVGRPEGMTVTATTVDANALAGTAEHRNLRLAWKGPGGDGGLNVTLVLPKNRSKPVSCFLLICHRSPDNFALERKTTSSFWPVDAMIARGYAMAAFYTGEIDPDKHDGFKDGVHALFDTPGQPRADDAWGTIAAWAWGASRAIDAVIEQPGIDQKRIAVIGHSRGGKTALWCGAQDERVALTISNDSGCTGAALSRGKTGETVAAINTKFPHWFAINYHGWANREMDLPIDQHQLLALMAPRLVYVASASEDRTADPHSEFRACVAAGSVWKLFGKPGFGERLMPPVDSPKNDGSIGYHIRQGKHDLTSYDWQCFADFADRHWR